MKLPAWYGKVARGSDPGGELQPSKMPSAGDTAESQEVKQVIADPKTDEVRLLIDAETVIFDKSFKRYDDLTSIACWFMADTQGKQTFKEFKSINDQDQLVNGFESVNTTNLKNVEYAFGGFSSFEYENYFYGGLKPHKPVDLFGAIGDFIGSLFDPVHFLVPQPSYHDPSLTYDDQYGWSGNSFKSLDLTTLDLSGLKDFSNMFTNCLSLETVKFANNATAKATKMTSMFFNCESLGLNTEGDDDAIQGIKSFTTNNVTNMDRMFYGCSRLKTLDLSSFNTNSIVVENNGLIIKGGGYSSYTPCNYAADMFLDCVRLSKVMINSQFDGNEPFGLKG